MTHLIGQDRSQTLLLPESLDDYVGPENPVRFIEAFVDGLDLATAGFGRVQPKETGRPGYAPGDLLKLYVYGYLNRIRSSRRLESETQGVEAQAQAVPPPTTPPRASGPSGTSRLWSSDQLRCQAGYRPGCPTGSS